MRIFRKENFEVAFIDPQKKLGEEGQYVRMQVGAQSVADLVLKGKTQGFEIRRYVENLKSNEESIIPLKYVITDVPPGHVQPFHSHTNVDEINLVEEGEVYFIESDTVNEGDRAAIRAEGVLLHAGDVVVSNCGKRHTLANLSNEYTRIIGTISAKSSVSEFSPDWQR